jgi:small subunit ribosomal protein S1
LPELGAKLEVSIASFDAEDGLYRLSVPGAATPVGNWSQVQEGMIVEARVTGVNKGGLECEVSNLRGFIPASQTSLYRVEDLAQFVGQKLECLVTEVNPRKRKLVVSRRAVLEREKEQSRERLIGELSPGQVREGIVRDVRDFGAFIDLGGVDGLLHVSQLSWSRVNHPSELLQAGQSVTVKITKIDATSRKISPASRS